MEKKRIVLVSHNDRRGGAAIVTYRLMKTLQSLGHEADMLVFEKTVDDPHIHLLGSGTSRKYRFLKERLGIFCRNGFSRRQLFKVSTGTTGMDIANHPLVARADAIFLNWINQATVSLNEIARLGKLGKRIVWTMHDMWNMTGICHHAYSCCNYQEECGNCRYLGGMSGKGDLSHKIWSKKKGLYEQTD
ncbi:MAG: glycosyltransferase, partial [Muribaculaceae bacterium]|nr:glycosyltransferase [Muribaculaceae bacterium]